MIIFLIWFIYYVNFFFEFRVCGSKHHFYKRKKIYHVTYHGSTPVKNWNREMLAY
jgi:hypothetical protein